MVIFEEYFFLKLTDTNKSTTEIRNLVKDKFRDQDPQVVEKFQDVFLAAYKSRNLKSLEACRKEALIYKTQRGKNNGITMVYNIGITNSQDETETKEFVMKIGMKFDIWKIDDKVQIIALDDMYD